MNKKTVLTLVSSILLLVIGLALLIEGLVGDGVLIAHWYLFLLGFLVAMFLSIAITTKLSAYVLFAFFTSGLLLMFSVPIGVESLGYKHTWPLIFLMTAIGMIVTHFLSKKRLAGLVFGSYLSLVSIVFLISATLENWLYTLPSVLIITGLFVGIKTIVKYKKVEKDKTNQVLYVDDGGEDTD